MNDEYNWSFQCWIVDPNPQLIEANADGTVHKAWWKDRDGNTRYAEAPDVVGPWTVAPIGDNHEAVNRAVVGED